MEKLTFALLLASVFCISSIMEAIPPPCLWPMDPYPELLLLDPPLPPPPLGSWLALVVVDVFRSLQACRAAARPPGPPSMPPPELTWSDDWEADRL